MTTTSERPLTYLANEKFKKVSSDCERNGNVNDGNCFLDFEVIESAKLVDKVGIVGPVVRTVVPFYGSIDIVDQIGVAWISRVTKTHSFVAVLLL